MCVYVYFTYMKVYIIINIPDPIEPPTEEKVTMVFVSLEKHIETLSPKAVAVLHTDVNS